MFFQNRQSPYRYVKEVVIYDAAWFVDGKKKRFFTKVANAIWSDMAYKIVGCSLVIIGIGSAFTFSWPIVNSYIALEMERVGRFLVASSIKNRQETEVVAIEEEESKIVFEDREFNIEIEEIGLNSVVLPNIEAADPTIYTMALKRGLAHARGSALPGGGGAIYIFGHSTSYEWFVAELNAVFYKLKDLVIGDKVILRQNDKILSYKVIEKIIVEADDSEILGKYKDKDVLILQTCYPPGTSLKRLLVIAEPVK